MRTSSAFMLALRSFLTALLRGSLPTMLMLCALAASLCVNACALFEPQPVNIPDGLYEGEYTATYKDKPPTNRTETGSVSVTLSKGTFTIQSASKPDIVPQGKGNYSLKYRQITFDDRTERTTPFDTLRLVNGNYVYTFDGANLVMTQDDDERKISRQMFVFRK
jgi:hypothetical protein